MSIQLREMTRAKAETAQRLTYIVHNFSQFLVFHLCVVRPPLLTAYCHLRSTHAYPTTPCFRHSSVNITFLLRRTCSPSSSSSSHLLILADAQSAAPRHEPLHLWNSEAHSFSSLTPHDKISALCASTLSPANLIPMRTLRSPQAVSAGRYFFEKKKKFFLHSHACPYA